MEEEIEEVPLGRKPKYTKPRVSITITIDKELLDFVERYGKDSGIISNWGPSAGGVDRSAVISAFIRQAQAAAGEG